jgi:hypothetical protein
MVDFEAVMKARVLLCQGDAYRVAAELFVDRPQGVWLHLKVNPDGAGRRLITGDVGCVAERDIGVDCGCGRQTVRPGTITSRRDRRVLDAAREA